MVKEIKYKYLQYVLIFFSLCFICIGIVAGYYITSLIFGVGIYIFNEVVGSDHVYYDVGKNHQYQCTNSLVSKHIIKNNTAYISEDHISDNSTIFLEVTCKAAITGYFMDPFIEMHCGEQSACQYFERGFQGKRYLNISHLPLTTTPEISLRLKYCSLQTNDYQLISTKNPDISTKKVLVIAPHADDAEIAAFGLYSNHNSLVVTITSGESEPDSHLVNMTKNKQAASVLKGRLRAWDSVAIPLWAGLKPNRAVNLGYSDNTLEKLYSNKTTCFPSEVKREVRKLNTLKLQSDKEGSCSWQSLSLDLSEIIQQFSPEVIVTPHPEMDAHMDHRFSTEAIKEAVDKDQLKDIVFLYYINHSHNTDLWPFGPHGSIVAPPPGIGQVESFYSCHVDASTQINKACSLEMMHDLRKLPKIKHRIRFWLQKIFINRGVHPLGSNPYFRKSIRQNELFIVDRQKR
ncbi:MAG: PIG-L family deacetylase [Candidatus Endonucleobacter bathymodioli]|uniref:PIG-L family deacetylase n=1 Tax=Candidatus Endonucleibacter bathymodioli TaxID=539814 RepID=A0AA90SYD2_9GAMM|nr:PIG-L family deacetylase [Candidatus Endonucleobacter bathymodioli]